MTLVVNTRRNRGFTLIEVIVALGIIATAMAAVMMTVSANVRNATGLKERTLAHWVAMNKMAELHIVNYKEWPSIKCTDCSSTNRGSFRTVAPIAVNHDVVCS
ncbi:MAG: type II secretion system minor pseudopilin GspI [Gammaproteobacteria bacterium]